MHKARGLEYQITGRGEPVLLIHGALIADAMLPLAREPILTGSYRLIRYRRRGHGGSDPVSGTIAMGQGGQDARALLSHLDVERAHVIGHSGGGAIALDLALQAPSLVRSLALLEPALLPPAVLPQLLEEVTHVLEAHRAGDDRRAVDLWMHVVNCGDDWRSVVAGTVPGGAEQAEKDASTFFDAEFPAFPSWEFGPEQASRISQPILHLQGAESGPRMAASRAHFLSLFPRAEAVVLPGLNHAMQMGNSKRVAEALAPFLSRYPL
jgi:pimeloyl-ACP methyl ester carboxylesterase